MFKAKNRPKAKSHKPMGCEECGKTLNEHEREQGLCSRHYNEYLDAKYPAHPDNPCQL